MKNLHAVLVLSLALGGSAVAQSPGFQPKGEDQFKAATLHQQAVIEIKNMQVAQLEFNAADRRLQDVRKAQQAHEPALLKSVGAKPGSAWDWDRMVVREPPPPAAPPTEKPQEKPPPPSGK